MAQVEGSGTDVKISATSNELLDIAVPSDRVMLTMSSEGSVNVQRPFVIVPKIVAGPPGMGVDWPLTEARSSPV